MAYELLDLVVDRVDLVDEGANSAAFIELYKRKETCENMNFDEILSKLKPEHAEVVQKAFDDANAEIEKMRNDLDEANRTIADKDAEITSVNEELAKARTDIEVMKSAECTCGGEADDEGKCKECGKLIKKSAAPSEEDILKSMPEAAREMFAKMKAQKEAAEETVRKAAEEKAEAEAVAKAASLKAIPVAQDKLVSIVKSASEEVIDLLTTINAAIENTVLDEVGKNKGNGANLNGRDTKDAWAEIEAKADEIAKRDGVTIEKAISKAVSENPELYRKYLNGGNK